MSDCVAVTPVNTTRWTSVDLMFDHLLRRWYNIKTTTVHTENWLDAGVTSDTMAIAWWELNTF